MAHFGSPRWRTAILWLCFSGLSLAQAAEPLSLVTEDSPPFNMPAPEGGKIIGISTEIIEAALGQAGIAYSIALYPWARAYDTALHHPNSCAFSTNRTAEREKLFKWVSPISINYWTLFGRQDGPQIHSLEEARPYRISGHRGDAAVVYLKSQGFTVVETAENDYNLRLLSTGRVDFWIDNLEVGLYMLAHQRPGTIAPILKFHSEILALACNVSVPDTVIDRLNVILAHLHDDGTVARIMDKYQGGRPGG